MTILLRLAYRSLLNRRVTSLVTVLVIGLSVALLVSVNHVRASARDSFAGVISQTDLIVGPKGGATQLLLYTVFHMGAPTANVSFDSYQAIAEHPAVAWTIPVSLGDSHRGFRVVATDGSYFEHRRYHGDQRIQLQRGQFPAGLWDVAIGSAVADSLGYDLGDPLVVTHGLASTGIADHDDKPFSLVGLLAPTGTPIDQSVFVTLEGFEAMHIDWESGAPPRPGEAVAAHEIVSDAIRIDEITAFFVGTNSRMEALQLQREINTAEGEPLMAILPGVTLSELWRVVGYAENALLLVSGFVLVVGLLGLFMTIYTSLDARRREMAILRALGSGPSTITGLLVLEAGLVSLGGALLGLAAFYALQLVFQPMVRQEFGLYLPLRPLSAQEWLLLGAVVMVGALAALPAAWKAYRNALSDGLTVRL